MIIKSGCGVQSAVSYTKCTVVVTMKCEDSTGHKCHILDASNMDPKIPVLPSLFGGGGGGAGNSSSSVQVVFRAGV